MKIFTRRSIRRLSVALVLWPALAITFTERSSIPVTKLRSSFLARLLLWMQRQKPIVPLKVRVLICLFWSPKRLIVRYGACFHDDPSLPWYHQSFPWWMVFFLVPIYSTCSSLSNLQSVRSWSFPVMVLFSCITYAANKLAARFISNASDVGSAVGAFVISLLGNVYSRVFGGTAFTSMVTGVMFLVPVSPT